MASRGAYACAAGLVAGTVLAMLATDLSLIAARPGVLPADSPPSYLAGLATLPGPSPILLVGLVPAMVLLMLGHALGARQGLRGATAAAVHPLRLAVGRVADLAFGCFVATILALAVLPGLVEVAGWRLVAITSGSMAPVHPAGSMVLVRPIQPAALAIGDVIVFDGVDGRSRTHRIVAMMPGTEGPVFQVRGDAAPAPDADLVPAGSVTGRVEGSLAFLGALRAWLFAPGGILVALVVAAVLARGTATRRT